LLAAPKAALSWRFDSQVSPSAGHQLRGRLAATPTGLPPANPAQLSGHTPPEKFPEFAKAARTIRTHRDGITPAVDRDLTNGRHEGLNNKVRTMINRAYGFHTAEAALALIKLACGPVTLELPYNTQIHPHSRHRAEKRSWR
jgi:hypothetical protein